MTRPSQSPSPEARKTVCQGRVVVEGWVIDIAGDFEPLVDGETFLPNPLKRRRLPLMVTHTLSLGSRGMCL